MGKVKRSKPVLLHPHKILDETILTKKSLANLIVEALIDGDMELVKEVLIAQIKPWSADSLRFDRR